MPVRSAGSTRGSIRSSRGGSRRARRRFPVLLGVVLTIAGVAGAGYLVSRVIGDDSAALDEATTAFHNAPTDGVPVPVVNPPPEDPADVAMDTAVPTEATLHITYSGTDEVAGVVAVGAIVTGVIENGGRCSLVLTRGATTATAETDGLADASTTSCGQLAVPLDRLGPGTWTAEVTYTPPAGGRGVSDQTVVEVP